MVLFLGVIGFGLKMNFYPFLALPHKNTPLFTTCSVAENVKNVKMETYGITNRRIGTILQNVNLIALFFLYFYLSF